MSTASVATAKAHSNGFLQIAGADQRIDVPDGKYFFDTKARNERLMTKELSKGARQTHAALAPFTMYYRREVALRPDGKPATCHDLCKKTGFDKADQSRYLAELEEKGYGERRCTDDGARRKGKVLIISWAVPREPKKENGRCAHPQFPGWIPDTWQSLKAYAKRCRYKIPENLELDEGARTLLLEEGEHIARTLEQAQEEAARFLDGICAQAPLYKEERNEINLHKEQAGRQAVEEAPSVPDSLPACPPLVENQNGNATPEITTAEQILELPAVQQLEEQLQDTVGPDLAALIAVNLRDAPPDALNERILLKAKQTRSLALLPSLAADVAKANDARKTRAQKATAASDEQRQRQDARFIHEFKRDWSKLSEKDRQMAREAYPEVDWPGG